ncbi:hypothetical protein NPX13_g6815 [Xylaria arbuscula]|uniref:Uncharacterized protein n=1 Tax=Xylaria arbuscula TaxID=114810 RepID=A0A9W8TJS4_9PEZI|nr:hypothetical protein NPX13_g6815 [Xylaria arbuscula]
MSIRKLSTAGISKPSLMRGFLRLYYGGPWPSALSETLGNHDAAPIEAFSVPGRTRDFESVNGAGIRDTVIYQTQFAPREESSTTGAREKAGRDP